LFTSHLQHIAARLGACPEQNLAQPLDRRFLVLDDLGQITKGLYRRFELVIIPLLQHSGFGALNQRF